MSKRIPSVRRLKKMFPDAAPDQIERVREVLEVWRDSSVDARTTMRKASNILRLGELGLLVDATGGEEVGIFLARDADEENMPTIVYRHDTGTMSVQSVPDRLSANGEKYYDLPSVVSYYENWTHDDLEAGDTGDRGEHDDVAFALDEYDIEEGLTLVDLVVKYLSDSGVSEASSSQFHKGVWYDTEPTQDFRTGEWRRESYHLKGFSEEDEAEVYRQLTGKRLTSNASSTETPDDMLRVIIERAGDDDDSAARRAMSKLRRFIKQGGELPKKSLRDEFEYVFGMAWEDFF